jgi:dCMP deaminase
VSAPHPPALSTATDDPSLVLPGTPLAGDGFLAHVRELVARLPGGRPSWDEYFMAMALLISSRSPCERLHVGCVLVSGGEHQNRLVAAGYNGFLPGAPHLSRVRDGHEQATVHAEQNAITDAARRGVSVNGATAYITHFPCVNCAKMLAAAGVRAIKYHLDYHNDPLVRDLMRDSRLEVTQL